LNAPLARPEIFPRQLINHQAKRVLFKYGYTHRATEPNSHFAGWTQTVVEIAMPELPLVDGTKSTPYPNAHAALGAQAEPARFPPKAISPRTRGHLTTCLYRF
jgi:hypothetical protein